MFNLYCHSSTINQVPIVNTSNHQFIKFLRIYIYMCLFFPRHLCKSNSRVLESSPWCAREAAGTERLKSIHRIPAQRFIFGWLINNSIWWPFGVLMGDLTPCSVLHHAGGSSRQERDVRWNSDGTSFCRRSQDAHAKTMISHVEGLWFTGQCETPSLTVFLAYHPHTQTVCRSVLCVCVRVCVKKRGWRWWWRWWWCWWGGGTLHCRPLCEMLSTAGKLVQHLLWEEALSV